MTGQFQPAPQPAQQPQPAPQPAQQPQPAPQPAQQPQPAPQPTQQPQPAPQPTQQPQPAPQPAQQPQPVPQPAQQPQAAPQPAPQPQNAYDSIIAQQKAQIEALINANNSLTRQVTQMVQNGAQFYQPQPTPQVTFQPQQPQQPTYNLLTGQLSIPGLLQDNEDYSLEALAKEIGKRDDLPPKK